MLVLTTRKCRGGKYGGSFLDRGCHYLDDNGSRLSAAEWKRRLTAGLAVQEAQATQRVVVVIHGFNEDHADAIDLGRMVKSILCTHLDPAPVVIAYSWPSNGRVTSYIQDVLDAETAGRAMAARVGRYLDILSKPDCTTELCIVTHSLGARVLAECARVLWYTLGRPRGRAIFSEVALCHPDLDGEALFENAFAWPLVEVSRRVTVLGNVHDRALKAREAKVAGLTGARLGRKSPANPQDLASSICYVDVSGSALARSDSHSVVFEDDALHGDLAATLAGEDRSAISGRESVISGADGAARVLRVA